MHRTADLFRKSSGDATRTLSFAGTSGRGALPDAQTWDFPSEASLRAHGDAAGTVRSPRHESAAVGVAEPSEDLLALAQRLFLGDATGGPLRSVIFAAVGSEDASTGVCAGTATALAIHTAASVCIVDANLRAPSLDAWFGVTGTLGLSNALLGECTATGGLTRLRGNLWLLPAGSRAADAATTLVASELRVRLHELQDHFEHVILNVSGATADRDLVALAPVVDGVVLVIDALATRRETARRVVEDLRAARVDVLGAVLTNRTFPIPPSVYRRL